VLNSYQLIADSCLIMKRKDFIKNTVPAAALLPAIVDGYSVKAFTGNSPLMQALMSPTIDTDHVLVIVLENESFSATSKRKTNSSTGSLSTATGCMPGSISVNVFTASGRRAATARATEPPKE